MGCGKGGYSIYCKAPNEGPRKENGQFVLKRHELPDGFHGRVFIFIYLFFFLFYLFIFYTAGSY